MKKIIRFTLLLISSCASAQLKTELEGKTFITKIGSVCEETNVPDACAGYNTYFEITFNEQNAIIFEKGISSCKELRYSNTYTTEWMFEEQNKIILKNVEPHYDDGQKIFVDNILIFEDNKLTAKPENKYYGEYVFEILPQKSKNQDEKSKLKDLLAMQQLKEIGRMNVATA
ncbi:hypothetical protein SAMN05421741_106107 [Paenimyroides ummariense]|uniref:NlpE N-terminal domain-containing protein n=1 Tax=Paenimyroides ummariense TaxID=913024 RepID=A0A1I4ZKL3_9FLAO|nr:hypothetical protein [Paenimyroides ummariense]SFN50697.1 hypothetical protein SAMN05421741_106107 [Paenimyroides ummariense]